MLAILALASAITLASTASSPVSDGLRDMPEGVVRLSTFYVKEGDKVGQPYRIYWLREDRLTEYLESDVADPVEFSRLKYFVFPITKGDGKKYYLYLQERRGRYAWAANVDPNELDNRLEEIARAGYRYYVVRGNWFGSYFFAHKAGEPIMVSPVTPASGAYLGMEEREPATYPLVKLDEVAAKLKAAINEARGPVNRGHEGHDHE